MNISVQTVNKFASSVSFEAAKQNKKNRGQKPSEFENFLTKMKRYESTGGNSEGTLILKIKRTERIISEIKDKLRTVTDRSQAHNYSEDLKSLNEVLSIFKKALSKICSKKA